MDTDSVVETIAERVEQELARVRAARPALASRVARAENIVVTHLSCRRQRVIRVRANAVHGARFLVSGSGGAVYVVSPSGWSCSCPDHHRRGTSSACKHSIACWALWRASARPAHRVEAVPVEAGQSPSLAVAEQTATYETRTCSACWGEGMMWDEAGQRWAEHDACSGTGTVAAFVYPKAGRLRECEDCRERYAGRDLFEVHEDHGSLTWFVGDELCDRCALRHGVL